ncbi:hypothetical protein H6F32_15855 [Anabaena sp. FACHB-1237]|nr:hypothetical protein [Anabaena sp. FACHB-1237]
MQYNQLLICLLPVLVINTLLHTATAAEVPSSTVKINSSLKTDPMIFTGKSGGTVKSDCGYISDKPSQVIEVTQDIRYLRLNVETQGKPNLLVVGPTSRFCVLSDAYSNNQAQLSGYWPIGKYSVYVGESSTQQYHYTLSISTSNK